MPYRVFIIKTDGTVTFTDQPKAPTLEQSQAAVGGYIETIPYFSKFTHEGVTYSRGKAYANEDGFSKGLPENRAAGEAWRASFPQASGLLGDVQFYAKIK